MDKCRILKELSSYLDNQLCDARKNEIENHLRGCKVCSDELAKLKLLSEKLKAWQVPDLGLGFEDKVRNEIVLGELERGEVKMKKKTLAILIPSGALAGILVVAFLGVLIKSGVNGKLQSSGDKVGVRKGGYTQVGQYQGGSVSISNGLSFNGIEAKDQGLCFFGSAGEAETKYQELDKIARGVVSPANISMSENVVVQGMHDISFYPKYARTEYAKNGLEEKSYQLSYAADPGVDKSLSLAPPASLVPIGSTEGPVIVVQPTIPATGEGDKIIRTGFISVESENGKEAYNKALGICNELGGYMAGSNFYKTKEGKEAGTIIMRIPKDKFTIALDKLSTLGKVENINTSSQDVSQEYANFKSQLDAAMVVYNKMLEALQKRSVTIPEAVRLESELTPVLRRVEDLKNKIEYLNKSVAYTTVNFNFYESAVSFKTLKESRKFIQESMINAAIKAIKFAAAAIPVLIVVMVLIGITAVVGLAVKQWIKQLLKRD